MDVEAAQQAFAAVSRPNRLRSVPLVTWRESSSVGIAQRFPRGGGKGGKPPTAPRPARLPARRFSTLSIRHGISTSPLMEQIVFSATWVAARGGSPPAWPRPPHAVALPASLAAARGRGTCSISRPSNLTCKLSSRLSPSPVRPPRRPGCVSGCCKQRFSKPHHPVVAHHPFVLATEHASQLGAAGERLVKVAAAAGSQAKRVLGQVLLVEIRRFDASYSRSRAAASS